MTTPLRDPEVVKAYLMFEAEAQAKADANTRLLHEIAARQQFIINHEHSKDYAEFNDHQNNLAVSAKKSW